MCFLHLCLQYVKCVFENCILYLEKKEHVLPAPAEQIEFEPYKKYDINVGVGTYGFSFSSVSSGTDGGCHLGLASASVTPLHYYDRQGSFAVRPVAEN